MISSTISQYYSKLLQISIRRITSSLESYASSFFKFFFESLTYSYSYTYSYACDDAITLTRITLLMSVLAVVLFLVVLLWWDTWKGSWFGRMRGSGFGLLFGFWIGKGRDLVTNQERERNRGVIGNVILNEEKKGLRAGGFVDFGEWTPQPFAYPSITPIPLPVSKLEVPKYRPFKWGDYHITMGIRNMPFEEWIEVDCELEKYYEIRKRRMEVRGERVVRVLGGRRINVTNGGGGGDMEVTIPGAEGAAKELVYELSEYLSRRYPLVYSVTRENAGVEIKSRGVSFKDGWYSEGKIRTITMIPIGVTFDLEKEDSMSVAGLLIQDDLAIMVEGSDGRYYFQGGAICLPGFWRMEDKLGMPLEEIHISGDVPQYREKLQKSMGRFFGKMKMDKAVLRNNYFFQVVGRKNEELSRIDVDELAWSDSTNGEEDKFDQVRKHEEVEHEQTGIGIEDVRFRTERQSLRRLGFSGAIVFSIRTYIIKIVDMVKEEDADIRGRLASAIKSWPEDVAKYKGRKLLSEIVIPYLEGISTPE